MQLNKGGTCILEGQTKADLKMILDTEVNFNLKNDAGEMTSLMPSSDIHKGGKQEKGRDFYLGLQQRFVLEYCILAW